MMRLLVLVALLVAAYLWWRWDSLRLPVARLLPGIAVGLALLYLALPLDLIPDTGPVGLIDDLIVLGGSIYWARQQRRRQPRRESERDRPTAGGGELTTDPHEVLGLPRGASREEITRAYREQMKLYHPDRVSGLGSELQKVANEKTIEIQRAYEALRDRV